MPTIPQLPLANVLSDTDLIPLNQGDVLNAVQVGLLLNGTQPAITLPTNALLGRSSPGPGAPQAIALNAGLQIANGVLSVDQSSYPQADALDPASNVLLNSSAGQAQLMGVTLLRGLYSAGSNITIGADGTISNTPTAATGSSLGAVAVGQALVINASGQLSVNLGAVSGTAAAGNDARIVGAEQTANKGQPNGYAALDVTGLVPLAQLPATGSVSLNGANASPAIVTPSASGAVARTLAAHFTDVLNINDFGLARNGTTDDSALFVSACQTAIALGKQLYIPAGGPILLTDAAQQNLQNISIFGDGPRDYAGSQGYGHVGSPLWFTGRTKTPFLLGPNVQFRGINFFWPNQTEVATVSNAGQPIAYPPLFAQQISPQNIVYFEFIDCQVTNCYDFFTSSNPAAVVGGCTVERCMIYANRNCFTFINNPEVFFIGNTLFTWGTYGSIVSVGPTYNLRTFTNTQGCWMKVLGNGSQTAGSTTVVGGIQCANVYVYGSSRGIWLAAGTLDVSDFANTSFDTVPQVMIGDPGCAMFSTRFVGGTWYPIYLNGGLPDTTAIMINNPAPAGIGLNVSFSAVTVPFISGNLVSITGASISDLSFADIRCNAFGHTNGGTGPYIAMQFNTPNANIRISDCDMQASNGALSNTGVQIAACTGATVAGCIFRNCSAPLDIETAVGQVTLIGNTTQSTQGTNTIIGIGTTNVHDLGNNWDRTNFAYNGFAPDNYRAGATIGLTPVACTAASGYVGVQPSALGTNGGTRIGLTSAGSGVVSLLTNNFNEEQVRVNRLASVVNYLALRGSTSGQPSVITAGGGDANASVQITGVANGPVYLGTAGSGGSPTIRLGASIDQSYVLSTPANGFFINVPVNCATVLLKPAGNLSSGTISLPAALADGEHIAIWSTKTITALTVTSATGATVNGGSGFQLGANATVGFFWNAASASWFQSLSGGMANGSIAGQNANSVTITGGSITGLASLAVGADNVTAANVVLDTAPGYARQVVFESASSPRWVAGVEGDPENNLSLATSAGASAGATALNFASTTGVSVGMLVNAAGIAGGTTVSAVASGTVTLSAAATATLPSGTSVLFYTNQGADFAILPYDDAGAPLWPALGQSLLITRASGLVTIQTLAINGQVTGPTPATADRSTKLATTAFVGNAIAAQAVALAAVGAASGVAALDSTGRVPTAQLPSSVQGALDYQGTWNASTNAPALASGSGIKGFYYTVATTGGTALDGISQWNAGDHAAFNGTAWEKLDGLASEVISGAGRTGAITLSTADVSGLGTLAAQNGSAVAITGGTAQGLTLLSVGSNTGGTVSSFIDRAAGYSGQFVYQTAGVSRWNLVANATAESGGNAGSDFQIAAYADTGALLFTPITITRATGAMALSATPTHPSPTAGDNTTKSATTAYVMTALGGYAASGANSSITSLSGLTTALSVAQGGTGGATAAAARTALAAAASGANSDITALGALTTAISPAQGGTGAASLTGYVVGNGTAAMTASATIPNTAISGLGAIATQDSANVAITGGTIAGVSGATAAAGAGGTALATQAYADTSAANATSGKLIAANNLSDVANAATARTNLGLGTAATLATTALAQTANNLSDLASSATARTNLGLGTAATLAMSALAQTANNLSDLASPATARTNLGLGTLATQAAGSVAITGGTAAGLISLGLGSSAGPTIVATLNAAAANPRQVVYQTAGVSRWNLMVQADTESAQVNTTCAATTSSSTTLTVASGTGIVNGMSISGAGVAGGTLVASGGGTTTLTLSAVASVASGAALSFYANAGSSFGLRAYDDGGNLMFAPLNVARASGGAITMQTNNYGPLTIQSNVNAFPGSTRGAGAFDGQQYRTAVAQVASGQGAAIFGQNNTGAGLSAFVTGANNTGSGSYSRAGGYQASDRGRYGVSVLASGLAATQGDTQTAFGILRAASTTSLGGRLTADANTAGATNCWNLPSAAAAAYRLRIEIMGWYATGGLAVSYTATCRLKKTGTANSTTTLSNTTVTADSDNDAITGLTAPTIAADVTNGGINITSGFSTSFAMRWAARIISAVELQ